MKNILIITAVFPPEPVVSATLSRDLAEELSITNEVTVLCPKPTRPHGFKIENNFEPHNYKVLCLNSFTFPTSKWVGRLRESYSFGKHCQKYIKLNHKNIDTIYANTWPLLAQYLTVSTAKKLNIDVLNNLEFKKVDPNRYPMIKLLNFLPKKHSLFETVIVSANDALVNLFLDKKIKFIDIQKKLFKFIKLKEFSKYKKIFPNNAKDIINLNNYVRLKIIKKSV